MAPLVWALISAGLFVGELATGAIDFLFPALAALAVSLLSLIPGFSEMYWLQALLWTSMSLSSVVWLRRRFPGWFSGRIAKTDPYEHAGREARVIEAIAPGQPGRITYQGTTWTALSLDETIAAGQTVSILEQEGLSFVVSARPLIEQDSDRTENL